MVALDKMMGRTKKIIVHWDGEEVEVSYFTNVVTPAMLEKVEEAAQQDNLDVLGVMLEPVLDYWDILETEGGRRLDTDAETIKTIPMSFLTALQKAIEEDQNPPEGSSSDDS